jgi:hypothetical protein
MLCNAVTRVKSCNCNGLDLRKTKSACRIYLNVCSEEGSWKTEMEMGNEIMMDFG